MNHNNDDSLSTDDSSGSTDRCTVSGGSIESLDSRPLTHGIKLEISGRVFASYVDEPSGPLAYVNVSSDSENRLGSIHSNGDKTFWVGISGDHDGLSGFLLTEVFLTRSSKVMGSYFSVIVIEDHVLTSSSAVTITVLNSTSLQIDVASMTVSEEARFEAYTSVSITLFTPMLSIKYLTVDISRCTQKSVPTRAPNSSDASSSELDSVDYASSTSAAISTTSPGVPQLSASSK